MIVTESEMYQIIGELYVARAKTDQLLKLALERVEQQDEYINDLREQNGKLVQPTDNDAIRRFPSGVQGEGRRRSDDVQGCSDQSADGSHQDGSSRVSSGEAPGI